MAYPENHILGAQRNGLNLVGMNMGDFDRVGGPIREGSPVPANYPIYSDALLNWCQAKNVKSVRLMFTWKAVQSTLGGPVPPVAGLGYANYWSDLTNVLTRLAVLRDIYVILSPWQYNTASGDTDIVYDDAHFTSAHFADFWGKFATAINGVIGNQQRVAFDLINEPHTHAESGNRPGDLGITLADWFAYAQAAINAIRATGAKNTIFVPGMDYASASSFTTNGSSMAWQNLTEPSSPTQKNIAVTAHCYDGLTKRNGVRSVKPTKVLRDACSKLVDWARPLGVKVNIGEIALDAGPNDNSYCSESTLTHAYAQWTDWNKFCRDNKDVLVGWNWWANSAPKPWWDQADSCGGSHWGLTLDDGASQTVYMDLISGIPN